MNYNPEFGICMNEIMYNYLFNNKPIKQNDLFKYIEFIRNYVDMSSSYGTILGTYLNLFKQNNLTIDSINNIKLSDFENLDIKCYNDAKNEIIQNLSNIDSPLIKKIFNNYFECFNSNKDFIENIIKINNKDNNIKKFFDDFFIIIDNRINLKKDSFGKILLFKNIDDKYKSKVLDIYYEIKMNGGVESINLLSHLKPLTESGISIINKYSNVFVINKDETKLKRNGNVIENLSTKSTDLKTIFNENCKIINCDTIFNYLVENKLYKDIKDRFTCVKFTDEDIKKTHPYIASLILCFFSFTKSKENYNGGYIYVILKKKLDIDTILLNYLYELIDLLNGNPSFFNDDYREYFIGDIKDCKEVFNDLETNNKQGLTFFVKRPKEKKKSWRDIAREEYRNDIGNLVIANNYNYGQYSLPFGTIK